MPACPAAAPSPISAVLVHVSDVNAALTWYQRAFPHAVRRYLKAFDFYLLDINGVHLELVPSDAKVTAGAAGSVVYWRAVDFDQSVAHFLALGGRLYRGPLEIQDGLRMCQILDPWGNCIGLRG
ncbi:glyoxalase/bleomycin resistance/dioxygenase family protein [Paraburkholderia bonniea]|uniref:glyoxalase/bleomycin resistance/dioxygenase family protein n=1 Tax=Paraburkholderia bonniea TaxID=2152891 RepID=UPI0012914372|nr:glyoxalase/bleomycin resistance/dioxygenase family protein [Paraburkholderia bonniea]